MKIQDTDIIFISYDEPNCELNWADLKHKAPWAQRVHGVKGSDNAHKEAANMSRTDWFVTIDGDNCVYYDFFDMSIDEQENINAYSFCGKNCINGLSYGNGGPKIWNKDFVLNMKTHEAAEDDRAKVDFCWESGYKNFPAIFSESIINHSPYQAWRAGFREGVKMLLLNGVKPKDIKEIYWHNIHRFKVWASVGSHVKNGNYAVLGARMGAYFLNCTDWDYVNVRDFDELKKIYDENVNHDKILWSINQYGKEIKQSTGIHLAYFDEDQSQYMFEIYDDAINLGRTYYSKEKPWKSIS